MCMPGTYCIHTHSSGTPAFLCTFDTAVRRVGAALGNRGVVLCSPGMGAVGLAPAAAHQEHLLRLCCRSQPPGLVVRPHCRLHLGLRRFQTPCHGLAPGRSRGRHTGCISRPRMGQTRLLRCFLCLVQACSHIWCKACSFQPSFVASVSGILGMLAPRVVQGASPLQS